MRPRSRSVVVTACTGVFVVLSSLLTAATAHAHGTMGHPVSRIYNCYRENPEYPKSDACKAAIAKMGSTAPMYDWMEVNIPDANGRHKEIIPDGELCSAGREKFNGLDLPRDDWVATTLPAGGGPYTFDYAVSAGHIPSYFLLYITKEGYDPTKPLTWSTLEAEPFAEIHQPPTDYGYVLDVVLPERTGRHLIYGVWQRKQPDSGEAFYSCSDVVFE